MAITKGMAVNIIEKNLEYLTHELRIDNDIEVYVIGNTSKDYATYKKSIDKDFRGLSMIDNNGLVNILVTYNEHKTRKDVLNTLVHELLHVKFNSLRDTPEIDEYEEREEEIVIDLADFIVNVLGAA